MSLMGHLASCHPDHQLPQFAQDWTVVDQIEVVNVAVSVQRGLAQNCTEQPRADLIHPYSPYPLCKHPGEHFEMGIQGPGGLYVASHQLPKARHPEKTCHSISLFDGK